VGLPRRRSWQVDDTWPGMLVAMRSTAAQMSPGIVTSIAAATARHSATVSCTVRAMPGSVTMRPYGMSVIAEIAL